MFLEASFRPLPAGGNYCLLFQCITEGLERLEGKDLWAGTQPSPRCYSPLEITQAYSKGAGKQTGKTPAVRKYSDSNPETSWRPAPQPRELHKCHFKTG